MVIGMAIDLCNKKKTNNAQTIKGTKREVFMFGSLCSISVRGDSNRCILGGEEVVLSGK